MKDHTVTVTFDDDEVSVDDLVGALNEAGYVVPRYEKTADPTSGHDENARR